MDEKEVGPQKTSALRLKNKGSFALLEWTRDGYTHRSWVEQERIEGKGSDVLVDNPEGGIPYGVPWEHVLYVPEVTTADIAESLRKHGIWTAEDLRFNPTAGLSAIQSAYGVVLSALLVGAEQFEKEVHGA